jgi:selenocysteine-specific elongation factor
MHVVATAGHAGHGKTTLVRALTATDCVALPSGREIALLDTPGDPREVPALLAAAGTAGAVLFVIAADEGWQAQSAEHLTAIEALGLRHGLLVMTRADRADPAPALRQARAQLERSALGPMETLVVSAKTGRGLDDLLAALDRLTRRLPDLDPAAPARFWTDPDATPTRLTGTLTSGTLTPGDDLLHPGGRATILALEIHAHPTPSATAPARATLHLTPTPPTTTAPPRDAVQPRDAAWPSGAESSGVVSPDAARASDTASVRGGESSSDGGVAGAEVLDAVSLWSIDAVTAPRVPGGGRAGRRRAEAVRGVALVEPGVWTQTRDMDVRIAGVPSGRLPREMVLHLGTAAVRVRVRPLGPDTARLVLNTALPMHVGERAVLRDPVARTVVTAWALDVRPPALTGRGAGAARARELADWPDRPGGDVLLRRHGVLRPADLAGMGCSPPPGAVRLAAGWLADPVHWAALRERLGQELVRQAATQPHAPGLTLEAARLLLGLPARSLVADLVRPPLRLAAGRIYLE